MVTTLNEEAVTTGAAEVHLVVAMEIPHFARTTDGRSRTSVVVTIRNSEESGKKEAEEAAATKVNYVDDNA